MLDFAPLVRLVLILFLFSASASAASLKVLALFPGKALLQSGGQSKLIKQGESFAGFKLIEAHARAAVVETADGERQSLKLSQSLQSSFKAKTQSVARIYADRGGMFRIDGSINGQSVDFLVDTGASFIAMSETQARALGLPYLSARRGVAQTASDVIETWELTLPEVRVGEIKLRNVKAAVVTGEYPKTILLGMSFLQRLDIERSGSMMLLKQKY